MSQLLTSYAIDLAGATDRAQVGGKALHLQRALSTGIRVPAGFVIPRHALSRHLAHNGLTADVNHYLAQSRNLSQRELRERHAILCAAIMAAPLPTDLEQAVASQAKNLFTNAPVGLAVRSSGVYEDGAESSFAGIYRSYLGITTEDALWEAICRCWCTTWSPGALAYAHRMKIHLQADAMALIVQQVLAAESAGVIFTADPLTGNPWQFVINATFGLAQDVLGGTAPADTFVIAWDTLEIVKQQIVEKHVMLHASQEGVVECAVPLDKQKVPSLSHEQVREVAQIALDLDRAFDARVDVEFVLADGDVHVVQVRPLRALPTFFPHVLSEVDAKLTWMPSDPVWYRSAKPGERLVAPFFRDRWALEMWLRHSPGAFFPQQSGQEQDFNGYRYQTEWHWAATRYSVDQTITWLEEHEAEMRAQWIAQQHAMLEVCENVDAAARGTCNRADLVPALLQIRAAEIDFTAATWGAPQWMIFTCEWLLTEILKGIVPDFAIGRLLQGLPCLSQTRTEKAQALGRGIVEPAVRVAFMDRALDDVLPYLVENHLDNHFLQEYETFCWQFGMIPPTWPEAWRGDDNQAQILLVIKKSMLGEGLDARTLLESGEGERAKAETELLRILEEHNEMMRTRFQQVLAWAHYWTPELDNRGWLAGYIHVRLLALMRRTAEMLVHEGVLDDSLDIYLLPPEALTQIASSVTIDEQRRQVQRYKHDYKRNRRLAQPPFLGQPPMQSEELEREQQSTMQEMATNTPTTKSGLLLKGDGLAPGKITGMARKTEDLGDAAFLDSLTAEDILVYPGYRTWPDWLSLFMVVKGVVMVQGVQLHHAAQIARECGVPFVNLSEDVWNTIPDGAILEVDGQQGTVIVVA